MAKKKSLRRVACCDDFIGMARRRVPRIAFDYLDGGAGSSSGVARNREALDRIALVPKFFTDVSERTTGISVFDRTYDLPIAIAPMGLANFIWPGADMLLAEAARNANIPYLLSTAGTSSIEEISKVAPDHLWFQLFAAQREEVTLDLLRRARESGIDTLVVTIDAPVAGRKYRDTRNEFTLPLKLSAKLVFDILSRPMWAVAMARQGPPIMANVQPYAEAGASASSLAAYMAGHITAKLDVTLMKRIRDAWPGKLLVKGVMSVQDARTSLAVGADGIIVSNHGGRQLEAAPASIDALIEIRSALGDESLLMLDGGIDSGLNVVRGFSQGADFTFAGRAFLYAAMAAGMAGVEHLIELLKGDILQVLALIGRTRIDEHWVNPPQYRDTRN